MQITINGETIDVDEECAGCQKFYDLMCHMEGYVIPYSEYYKRARLAIELGEKCSGWVKREDDEATTEAE